MALLQIMNGVKGPLPQKVQFNSQTDGPAYLTLAGSAWSPTANVTIGVVLQLDGTAVGSAVIFSNQPSEHRALIPVQIPVQLTSGAHTVTLVPLNGQTTTDVNDYFYVSLIY